MLVPQTDNNANSESASAESYCSWIALLTKLSFKTKEIVIGLIIMVLIMVNNGTNV